MKIVKIKNLQETSDVYCGQTIEPNEYFQIPNEGLLSWWRENEKVNQHLWSIPAKICVNNGDVDLNSVDGDKWLKDDSIIIENTAEIVPSDLVITWTQMKAFYDLIASCAMMNYIDLTTHYYIWLLYKDQKMFVPVLVKGTSECTQFETYYKSKCNIPEWPRFRPTVCKSGRKMHNRYISFTTSIQDSFDNTDYLDVTYGDVVYKMIKIVEGVRSVTTDPAECKETWLDFEPSWDYEIGGGNFSIPPTLSGDSDDSWEIHVVAVPDLSKALGGSIEFVANPRLKWLKGRELEMNASQATELKYSATYHSNKLRFIVKHPVGVCSQFQVALTLYK